MKIKMKRILGIQLSLALVLGLMPGMSLTVHANSSIVATEDSSSGYTPTTILNGDFEAQFGDGNHYHSQWTGFSYTREYEWTIYWE